MATYFDPTNAEDKKLLPESMRSSTELANLHAVAERDVIRHFTRRRSSSSIGFPTLAETVNQDLGLAVFLLGYKADSTDADVDADLKQALKETIADVIAWRFKRINKDGAIASETVIGKALGVKWRPSSSSSFPPNFAWRLSNFDLRTDII